MSKWVKFYKPVYKLYKSNYNWKQKFFSHLKSISILLYISEKIYVHCYYWIFNQRMFKSPLWLLCKRRDRLERNTECWAVPAIWWVGKISNYCWVVLYWSQIYKFEDDYVYVCLTILIFYLNSQRYPTIITTDPDHF